MPFDIYGLSEVMVRGCHMMREVQGRRSVSGDHFYPELHFTRNWRVLA